ncbi:MAG TPA: bifunctional YncE family protein/alkaline phosphatase family protein [Steroidobacteraceae bacterium]|nr:bifunctional YncE family protein/alkaline phosphatase family protein [Steroidobacteraceae bacterium]
MASKSSRLIGALVHSALLAASAAALADPSTQFPTYNPGPQPDGSYVMSTGQIITPAGTMVNLGSPVRAKDVVLNPTNPETAAVLLMGASSAVDIVDVVSGAILQQYSPNGDSTGSFTGITYSPDGKSLLFSQDDSYVAIANVDPTTGLLSGGQQLKLAPSQADINCKGITVGLKSDPVTTLCGNFYNGNTYTSDPAGIAISADSKTAYVILNQNNTLQAVNLAASPAVTEGTQIRVGNAPNSVVLNGTLAYVSNEGGRIATANDFTNISSGTPIVASRVNGSSITGTISVVDTTTGKLVASIDSGGRHPTGMTISGNTLYVTNTGSDNIGVIDLATNRLVRTIDVAPRLGNGHLGFGPGFGDEDDSQYGFHAPHRVFGAEPTSLAVVGQVGYVTLYTANAVAVVDLSGRSRNHSALLGLIPTGSTPAEIAYDAKHNQLIVSDDKGLGTWGSQGHAHGLTGYNSHQDTASLDLIPVPDGRTLQSQTTQVYQDNHWDLQRNIDAAYGGNRWAAPAAIPAHIGDPSLIKHVFLIVRENRTYDQILGDLPTSLGGRGDSSLTLWGAGVTPNMHNLVTRFPLLDNYYDPSRQSADGHNWLVQGMAPYEDDIQSPDWIRSYPANGEDSLAYQPKGFLWDAAEKKGLHVKIYGEYVEYGGNSFANPDGTTNEPSWEQFYNDAMAYEGGKESQLKYLTTINTISEIPSVQNYSVAHFPNFDLGIPDQFRVDLWQPDFQKDVAAGTVPNLETLWIMCDHTGGPPTPSAEQADNDLAVGRVIDTITHSPIWKDSVIFVTEDDAQDGVDHIDGHRSPGYVISPYTVQNLGSQQANHTMFTQVNFTRTIEQILGLPPMNMFDLVASPMWNVFTNSPPQQNFAPWSHQAALVPLTQGVTLTASNRPMTPIEKAWAEAKEKMFADKMHKPDSEDPDVVNHWVWYTSTGFTRPYPGEKAVRWPSDFGGEIARPNTDYDD